MTGAGGESLNLQVSNNIIMFNLSFSVAQFVQTVGRIIRMDSEYDHMNIFILEALNTVDTYKRLLIQHHAATITRLLSGDSVLTNPNLPSVDSITPRESISAMKIFYGVRRNHRKNKFN